MSSHRDVAYAVLTEDRAAAILGTTSRRVRAWVCSGVLPGRRLPDGTVVLVLADLIRWIESADDANAISQGGQR